jgi:hypothetical protein
VTEYNEALKPVRYASEERRVFDVEHTVITRNEKEQFENEGRRQQQVFREVLQGIDAIVGAAESAIVQARRADVLSLQLFDFVASFCQMVGIDLDLKDGKLTLAHVGPELRTLALAAQVDKLKNDLEGRIGLEASRLREQMARTLEQVNGARR